MRDLVIVEMSHQGGHLNQSSDCKIPINVDDTAFVPEAQFNDFPQK